MKKLSYLFIALFISACQAEPDFTEEVTPLLHTRAGSLQFAQTDNLNLDALWGSSIPPKSSVKILCMSS